MFAEHVAGFGLELDSVRGHTLVLSIRLEAAQASREHHAARADARGHDIDVADLERFGRLNRRADDLTEAGGEHAQHGVPGQAGQVPTDEHEAGRAIDDTEGAGEDEPGR